MNRNIKVATTNAQKTKFENAVKDYIFTTTRFNTLYNEYDLQVDYDSEYGIVNIEYASTTIRFFFCGEESMIINIKDKPNINEVLLIRDIMRSYEEVAMMYDSVFKN